VSRLVMFIRLMRADGQCRVPDEPSGQAVRPTRDDAQAERMIQEWETGGLKAFEVGVGADIF
jgi:hypothetical protein